MRLEHVDIREKMKDKSKSFREMARKSFVQIDTKTRDCMRQLYKRLKDMSHH